MKGVIGGVQRSLVKHRYMFRYRRATIQTATSLVPCRLLHSRKHSHKKTGDNRQKRRRTRRRTDRVASRNGRYFSHCTTSVDAPTLKDGDRVGHIHVMLFQPRIPGNVGNTGRTVLGFGNSSLHLVHPCGFHIDDKKIKRAGLDYWYSVPLREWQAFHEVHEWLDTLGSAPPQIFLFSKEAKYGTKSLYDVDFFGHTRDGNDGALEILISPDGAKRPTFCRDLLLLFGSETTGITDLESSGDLDLLKRRPTFGGAVYLPQTEAVRSHNVSNMVSIAMFEARKQQLNLCKWEEELRP